MYFYTKKSKLKLGIWFCLFFMSNGAPQQYFVPSDESVPWNSDDYYQNRYEPPGRRRQQPPPQYYPPPTTSIRQGPYYQQQQPVTMNSVNTDLGSIVSALEGLLLRPVLVIDKQALATYNLIKCWDRNRKDFRKCSTSLIETCDTLFANDDSHGISISKHKSKDKKRKRLKSKKVKKNKNSETSEDEDDEEEDSAELDSGSDEQDENEDDE